MSFLELAGLPLVGFLLPRTPLRRVPRLLLRVHSREGSRGTRVARLSSVPSSGFLPLSTVPASTRRVSRSLDPAVCRGPQRFAAFFHAARVPGVVPPELSLPGEPYPLSRAFCFLAGSRSTAASAVFSRNSRSLSPLAPSSLPTKPARRRIGTHEPGRRFPAFAEAGRPDAPSAPYVPSTSREDWARRLTAGTPASKPCSPRESVPQRPRPWPGQGRPSVLSWDPHPSELSPPRFRVRSLAPIHAAGAGPVPRAPLGIQPPR